MNTCIYVYISHRYRPGDPLERQSNVFAKKEHINIYVHTFNACIHISIIWFPSYLYIELPE